MAQGEGVGVHDNSRRPLSRLGRPAQGGEIAGETPGPVLHEYRLVPGPGDLIKAQVPEHRGGGALGVQKQVEVPSAALDLRQVGDDLGHEALPLVGLVHRQAAEGGAEAAPRGDEIEVLVEHAAGVVQVPIPADAHRLQKLVHLPVAPAVRGGDGGDAVGHSGAASFCILWIRTIIAHSAEKGKSEKPVEAALPERRTGAF